MTHLESSDSNHALIESSWVRDRLQEGREGVYVQVARELQGVTVCCRWVSKIIYVPRVLQGVAERVLQCVAACCSVLQSVAACCSVIAVCCSVVQYLAVCCSVQQCVTVCCSVQQCCTACSANQQHCNTLQHIATTNITHTLGEFASSGSVCCSVLQCVAVCCSIVAMCCGALSPHTLCEFARGGAELQEEGAGMVCARGTLNGKGAVCA